METYLMHHGRKGQKWGRRNGPPYPLDYKKLSPEEISEAKKEAIRRGDVKEANYNRTHYTDDEIRAVINRYNLNKQMAEITAEPTKFDKFVAAGQKMGKAADAIGKGVNLYNHLAKISNAVAGTELPIVGESKGGNKDKKDNNGGGNNNNNNQQSKGKEQHNKVERRYENGQLVEKKVFKKDGSSSEKTWDSEGNLTKKTTNKVDRHGDMNIKQQKFDKDYKKPSIWDVEDKKISDTPSKSVESIGKILGTDSYGQTTKMNDINEELLTKNMNMFLERDRKKQNSFHLFDRNF